MATQTRSQRQAAAQRAAATRKRNAAKRSASATRTAARRTGSSASRTTSEARRTTRQASRTAGRRLDAATSRLGAFGRQAQRAALIQVGAAATVSDKVRETARTFSNLNLVTKELDRFERRGARALTRSQRNLNRQRRGLRSDVQEFAGQVRQLV